MKKIRLFVVPHTHYDAEVFLTRDVTLKLGADTILDVLHLLGRDPDSRFVLDQRAYLEGFAHLFPEQMAKLKEYVAAGQLDVVGGMHVMPDVNLPSGESLVRQALYGRAFFQEIPGVNSNIGWMLDSFGHHPQMPQIMRKAGYEIYAFQRGVADYEKPSAFWWKGLDGSRIRAEWMPHTYALLAFVPDNLPAFTQVIERIASLVQPYLYNDQYLVMSGLDLNRPDPHLPELIRQYNASQNEVDLVLATSSEYFRTQPAQGLIEREGDLNPVFTGCYTARIAMKQRNRSMENKLISVEKLMAVNWAQAGCPADPLEEAWEPVLFNQFHDLICGSHLDAAYERAMDRYKRADKLTSMATHNALEALAAQIDTRGEGIPLVVINLLSHPRTDVARCTVGLGHEKWESLALYNQEGTRLALQLEDVYRHPDGSLKRADLLFIAQVPPLGYTTYFLRSGDGSLVETDLWFEPMGFQPQPGILLGNLKPDAGRMGNRLVEVEANLRSGTISRVLLCELGWNAVANSYEHGFGSVCCQEDRGDPWEYYGPLRAAVTTVYPLIDQLPTRGQAQFSYEYGGVGAVTGGPVMAEMRVSGPFGEGQLNTRMRLYAGLPRLELDTELINRQEFVRYRKIYPLNLSNPTITYDIPFGAIQRPEGEYPAQNWVDVSNGQHGLALLNRGIPGHSLVANVLTASLLKCVKVVRYQGGGYSEDAKDNAGFEIGVKHLFEQAILPHRGNWQTAHLYMEGMSFNVPLVVYKTSAHAGALPPIASFLTLEPESVVMHALYVDGDELVLRAVEAAGQGTSGRVALRWPINSAKETDLIGNAIRNITPSGDHFEYSIQPFEIKTFRIKLR